MGNIMSNKNSKRVRNLNTNYRAKSKKVETLKKVWQVVENDLDYYGSSFGKILFENHPEYIKYFQYDVIPQYVQDAKMKRKLSSVCGIMSTLIVDYFNKPQETDDVLDFIAMIHKDMQLTHKDLENFLSDFLEMLIWEFPIFMTTEHIVIQVNYFSDLIHKMNSIMIMHRENDLKSDYYQDDSIFRSLCGWSKNQPMIYGKPLAYWEARKLYWCTRVALWSTLVSDFPNSTDATLFRKELQNHDFNGTKIRKEYRERNAAKSHPRTNLSETTSSISRETMLFEYRRKQSSERVFRKHLKDSQPVSLMETISEDAFESNINFKSSKNLRKGSIKKTEAFIHAVNLLKTERRNSEFDYFSSSKNENRNTYDKNSSGT